MAGNIFRGKSTLEMQDLCDLFTQPYWMRLWIVQEIYLAKVVILRYGSSKTTRPLAWLDASALEVVGHDLASYLRDVCDPPQFEAARKVQSAFRLLLEHRKRMAEQENATHEPMPYVDRWFQAQRANKRIIPLEEAIGLALERQCADVRDKVFGLQACIDPEQRVDVDYDATPEQVFWQVLRVFRAMELSHERRSRVAF
jgi:hypothetical protein